MAEVNDQGEVTVEGEFVGKLEGFRFRQDRDAQGQEAKTLKTASLQALAPHFHLRADRFYNAPDTEIDFTEQGGLMWGEQAVGKLAKGDDPLKPRIVAFVDDEAGADVAAKVERRLQHFMDRKIAALFEPLTKMRDDEALTGLARGFAFRLVESMGIVPRADVADEVKALDQDARGVLRKHGVRFGQYTIFMPLLLKPAPTRLRLVLWSLSTGLDEFPEAPPPGLVTVPNLPAVPAEHYALAGYRKAGARAIRIDMLERLADMIRGEDSRGGFEAKADMLSITGMTLEQFADLMQGLGYKAEKGEREKVKAVDAAMTSETGATAADAPDGDTPVMDAGAEPAQPTPDPEPEADDAPVAEASDAEILPGTAADAALAATPEIEIFYSFTWGGNRGAQNQRRGGGRPRADAQGQGQGQGRGQGGKPRGKGKGAPKGKAGGPGKGGGAKTYQARPEKKDRIDPDNPFAAALMGLTKKS